jgi:hypothetical protein
LREAFTAEGTLLEIAREAAHFFAAFNLGLDQTAVAKQKNAIKMK